MQIRGDKKNQKRIRYNQKTYIAVLHETTVLSAAHARWCPHLTQRDGSDADECQCLAKVAAFMMEG